MDTKGIITREEYNSINKPDYDQFCVFLMKLVKLSVEEALRALPHVMGHLSKQTDYLKNLSTKFYIDNKDLASDKPLVAKCIEQTESENPGKSYDEILKMAAEKARDIKARMNTKQVSFDGLKGL